MENTIKLTSGDDVLNFFKTIPHCSLTVEQFAEIAFKVADNNCELNSVQVIVPYDLIDTVCTALKNYGENFIDHYDLEDFESVNDDDYNKEYSIWIAFNIDIDGNVYNCHFSVYPTWRWNKYCIPEYQFILLHKDVSKELFDNMSKIAYANKIVTFDLLAQYD